MIADSDIYYDDVLGILRDYSIGDPGQQEGMANALLLDPKALIFYVGDRMVGPYFIQELIAFSREGIPISLHSYEPNTPE
jgi:hypothetical protein